LNGQTVIETVLMLTLLLVIFFMMAEFARAWYLKNSLNNAARVAVRIAVVANGLDEVEGNCGATGGNEILDAVCSSPGVPNNETTDVTVDVDVTGGIDSTKLDSGDTVTVGVRADFVAITNLLSFLPTAASSSAAMRYE
jgi:Flp pilus assembly protein TadG